MGRIATLLNRLNPYGQVKHQTEAKIRTDILLKLKNPVLKVIEMLHKRF